MSSSGNGHFLNRSQVLTRGAQTFACHLTTCPWNEPCLFVPCELYRSERKSGGRCHAVARSAEQSSCRQHCSSVMPGTCAETYAAFQYQPLGSLEGPLQFDKKTEAHTGKRKSGQTRSKLKSDFGSLLAQEREYGEQKKEREVEPIWSY